MDASLTESDKSRYWRLIDVCLVHFWGYEPEQAAAKIKQLQERVIELSIGDIYYHGEPYEVACDIAGKSPSKDQWAEYLTILDEFEAAEE